ncbi:hypothetical protein Smic_52920 [Streptomyces microflavus]|uniref:Arylamine N-acetyltransferase n=1 Tax=Streptomyces microflavus TaxID=1919 RepID=A0A7J0CW26_STRMI|nr:hypothetical protein Smic_52920 [Streptomyces microflavus]
MTLDLDAYLARIGWTGEPAPTVEVLRSLHRAHALGIPFENLDPVLGSAPSLALADLEAKLVRGGRGGYCYEHNTLFATVLRQLGFTVTLLAARVLLGAAPGDVRPRSHILLRVDVPGVATPYVADVGFGTVGALLEPIELVAGAELYDAPRHHRLVTVAHEGPLEMWELQAEKGGSWEAQYAFTPEPFEGPDFEMINWYVATSPHSPFAQAVYAQRALPDATHRSLAGLDLVETAEDGTIRERVLSGPDEVVQVLEDGFGIHVPRAPSCPPEPRHAGLPSPGHLSPPRPGARHPDTGRAAPPVTRGPARPHPRPAPPPRVAHLTRPGGSRPFPSRDAARTGPSHGPGPGRPCRWKPECGGGRARGSRGRRNLRAPRETRP